MKINHKFSKLLGHRQTGVLYLWTILGIIINISPDVAAGLKTRINVFGEKELKGLYPKGENVERLVLYYGSICHNIEQKGSLPEYAISDVLKGFSLASHEDFARLFKDYEINLKNLLLNVNMEGTVMYQIMEVMDTMLMQYTSYSFSSQRMKLSTYHANKISTPPPGLICDNCGDPKLMNQRPKDFDDERIARYQKARGALPRNRRGGGNGGCGRGGGRGCGGGGVRGRGRHGG